MQWKEQQIVTKNINKSIGTLYTDIFLIKNTAPYIRKECRVRLEINAKTPLIAGSP